MARQNRTPTEKADQALDVHERKIARVDEAIKHQKEVLKSYQDQRTALQPRLEHLLKDPDLTPSRRDPYDGPGMEADGTLVEAAEQ